MRPVATQPVLIEKIDYLSSQAVYVNCLFCYNKIDELSKDDFLKLAEDPENVVISCNKNWNLDELKEAIWKSLELVRIYTKKKGEDPDFERPIVLRLPATVSDLCAKIHKDFELKFKHAFVWGRSVKHSPQKVGVGHVLADEDVVQLFTK